MLLIMVISEFCFLKMYEIDLKLSEVFCGKCSLLRATIFSSSFIYSELNTPFYKKRSKCF